jgi:alkyl sulfatase BDS1-like metallo-beta-lactamase superfamily hydrolase
VDHVGGCGAFMADAADNKHPRPCVCGHINVARRFDRYNLTDGYNRAINARQFGQFREARFLPESSPKPDTTFEKTLGLKVGGLDIELHHAKGETDDHAWAWLPKHKAICAGDFFIWNFPNAGNPQKVQRYPREWAQALRDMAARDAELFLPAHGLPIAGKARIKRVLTEVADALDKLVDETLALMNDGARLNDIVHTVRVAPDVLERPYLRPLYDEPEFVVRNIWRLYGGWYDGNPANLKPARDEGLASEIAALAGGALKLAERAYALADSDPRVACHLAEMAALAAPDDKQVHAWRAAVFERRRDGESSLMAKGIFNAAASDSSAKAG